MDAYELPIAHPKLRGYQLDTQYYIFAADDFNASYWLQLKREGFSATISLWNPSEELDELMDQFKAPELADIYRLNDVIPPDFNFLSEHRMQAVVETEILASRIRVMHIDRYIAERLGDMNDPIYSHPYNNYCTPDEVADSRNELAHTLGKHAAARWLTKDQSDQAHWNKWYITRELIELGDMGVAVGNAVKNVFVALWGIVEFAVELVGGAIKIVHKIIITSHEFHTQLIRGDFEGIIRDLETLGVQAKEAFRSFEEFTSTINSGLETIKTLLDDPMTYQLLYDYIGTLRESMTYRDNRTIYIKIGAELLIAIALTKGIGHIAKALKAGTLFGGFPAEAIELMIRLAERLKVRKTKTDEPYEPFRVIPENASKKKLEQDNRNDNKPVIRTAAQDRAEISKLSKEADIATKNGNTALATQKINEAREILKPHLPKNPNDNWDAVVDRLDVSSPKDGAVFWSGAKDGAATAAQKFADDIGGVRLESTSGGRIINDWDDINKNYLWDGTKGGPPPYAEELWGNVSKKYAQGAKGKINVIQSPYAYKNGGGPTWINHELPELSKNSDITNISTYMLDDTGNSLQLMNKIQL